MDTIFTHRSIRKFKPDAIPEAVMERILSAATRASTVGNMQVYSIIVTESEELRRQLSPCHFGQPMVVEAPAVVTFCADVSRFSQWCRLRGAEPEYQNFVWFMNAAIDTLLASQNFSLQAEAEGLGICYLGTTLYTADRIIEILKLPVGVIPVTTVVVGYAADNPPLTDRLPLPAVVHRDTYKPYSDADIDRLWADREASAETAELLRVNNLPNLARIFTERRYKAEDNIAFSEKYLQVLKNQGFL